MAMNDSQEKIIDKIEKLLALSESDNENEAKAAMLKAQELMAKHSIEEERIGSKTERNVVTMTTQPFKDEWVKMVASVIADNFKCRSLVLSYKKTGGSYRIRYFGFYEDATICINVFQYAVKVVRERFSVLRAIYREAGRDFRTAEKISYVEGFCCGLIKNFEDQKEQNNQFALALVIPKEVNEFVDSIPNIQTAREKDIPKSDTYGTLFRAGVIDGKTFQNAGDKEQIAGGVACGV